jgi:hypothetical protein
MRGWMDAACRWSRLELGSKSRFRSYKLLGRQAEPAGLEEALLQSESRHPAFLRSTASD